MPSLRVMLAETLYARCTNPLDFWLWALPCLPQGQVGKAERTEDRGGKGRAGTVLSGEGAIFPMKP